MGKSLRSNVKKALRTLKKVQVLREPTTLKREQEIQDKLAIVLASEPLRIPSVQTDMGEGPSGRGRGGAEKEAKPVPTKKAGRKGRAGGDGMEMDVDETPAGGARRGLKIKKGGVVKTKRPVSKLIEITKMNMKKKRNGKAAKMVTTTDGYTYE